MDAVTYPQERNVLFTEDYFIPVRIHTGNHPELTEQYHVPWTPTFVVLGADGTEHYREIGYLPPDEFIPHLTLGLGRVAFQEKDYSQAGRYYESIVGQHNSSGAVPEAHFFLGICKGELGHRDERLAIWRRLFEEYPKSSWAKKVSHRIE